MNVLALAGGVGGGRMADGFQRCPAQTVSQLTVLVNTGDDLIMHGLQICPDLDSVTYTLSGVGDAIQGWGIAGDTHNVIEWIGRLGGPTWFKLGDRDYAVHIQRTAWLREGKRLTEVTALLTRALGVQATLLPMCDEPVATRLITDQGELEFQEYFVKHRQQPEVRGVRLQGIEEARITPEVARAWDEADLVIICPSNPFVSVEPILAVPGMRARLRDCGKPRIAVSPIIAGQAVKGPAARMMASLGYSVDVLGIADLYRGLIDALVIDEQDRGHVSALEERGLKVLACPTWMREPSDRLALASSIMDFAQSG
jgi:LPPG:FO 2-phospho-L-lactate transferase